MDISREIPLGLDAVPGARVPAVCSAMVVERRNGSGSVGAPGMQDIIALQSCRER